MKENNNYDVQKMNRKGQMSRKETSPTDQVEGRNAVLELLEAGKDINKLYIESGEKFGSINKI